ncbi:MAG: hypothetical protein EBY17_22665 [Acidobacteriia bacterium]|nr:hypothetical protein [Terriglobia bacterium]
MVSNESWLLWDLQRRWHVLSVSVWPRHARRRLRRALERVFPGVGLPGVAEHHRVRATPALFGVSPEPRKGRQS